MRISDWSSDVCSSDLQLDDWLAEITEALAAYDRVNPDRPSAPFAVNQIVHKTNMRLEEDVTLCTKWKVPIVITSLGARERSEEHTSELQSLMRISYAVFCLKKKKNKKLQKHKHTTPRTHKDHYYV